MSGKNQGGAGRSSAPNQLDPARRCGFALKSLVVIAALGTLSATLLLTATTATIVQATAPAASESQPGQPQQGGAVATDATTTTTTTATAAAAAAATATTTTTQPTTTNTLPANPGPTVREPTEQEINEARKIIQEVASSIKETNPHRLIMNKPPPSSLPRELAPDSPEARISDATSHFGLNLMRAMLAQAEAAKRPADNLVVSPLSLQILLNIVLLGVKDQSAAQLELAAALGYDATPGLTMRMDNSTAGDQRARLMRPHEAMHSLVEMVMKATHLAVEDRHLQQLLLNSNPTIQSAASDQQQQQQQQQQQFEAHLQTTSRENDTPLSGQLNFTLANLMLTSSDLVQTKADYERELRQYYNVKVEQFSRVNSQPATQSGGAAAAKSSKAADNRPLHVRVNEWVRNITQGQLAQLVDEATLEDPNLALVLINAAHFKGQWLHTFNTRLTEERTFYNYGTQPKDTRFMRQNGAFGYAEFKPQAAAQPGDELTGPLSRRRKRRDAPKLAEDGETMLTMDAIASPPAAGDQAAASTTVIEQRQQQQQQQQARADERGRRAELTAKLNCSALLLPFSLNDGQDMSMVLLLPNRRDGLDELLGKLDAETLNEVYKQLELDTQTVQVEVPKFSMESAHDARALLEALGVKRIFSDCCAELERAFGPGPAPVSVSKIIHRAKIGVDEQGAEAAAASLASVVMRSSIRVTIPTFTADRPFLYVVRHNRSNMPLFMGQVRSF